MTFDDIKEMRIGSKKVKEAWLNGRQVYPSEKRIMDSLVCWYDPGKQQCTNESMATNPVLADLSGNGHDIECFNFGWSGMSGIGGYVFSRPLANWYKSSGNNGSYTTEGNVLNITKLNTNFGSYYVTNNGTKTNTIVEITGNNYTTKPFKIKISGLPEGKLVRLGGLIANNTVSPNIKVLYENKYFGNGEHIVESNSVIWDDEQLEVKVVNYPCIYIDSDTADDVDITIEILPEYPNALVSDGVDDYCYTEGLPILTDYTVIAKRKWLQTENDNNDCFAAKGNKLASFLIERYGHNGSQECYSFGQYNGVSFVQEDVIYQTKESYNGYPLKVGTATDVDDLVILGRTSTPLGCIQAALYSFLLFDRTLTTAEIEWVKKNMIESNDDAAEWYGVEFYTTIPNPDCTRIGNPNLHRTLPVHSLMRGCLLNDDGSVNKYLDASTWESETRDGSQGQVMVEVPDHYMRFETDGNIRRVKLSTVPIAGYRHIKKYYVSAYEATVQRSTTMLCSVVNMDADYRGGNNNAELDGTSATFLGKPATSISRTNFRNYARKRKEGSSEWNCMTYDIQKDLFWLFVIEYATLNTQKAFNEALTADGYHQGGLGPGVTEINYTKWGDFNGWYPFIPCGHSDSLGNKTGVVDYTMPTEYDAASVKVCKVPRYRGIENPFGHIWQWTEGINVRISPNTEDGGDGLSKVFVCSDPSQFSDTGYEGYQYVGNEARTESYVKEVIFGEGGEIMPSVVGGGSTTYFCDYHYTNIPTSEALRGVLFGGYASNGAAAGFGYADSADAPSYTSAHFGSRLCFIPA